MAFGLSGSETSSQMEGADAVIAYVDGTRGYAVDYNITAKAPVRKYQKTLSTLMIRYETLVNFKCKL